MPRKLLIETMPVECQILEQASDKNGGRMKVALTVAACDEINENGRVYPEAIQDREIGKLNKIIEEGWAYASGDHPVDGITRWDNIAGLITKKIEKSTSNGRKLYRTEAVILKTEPKGKNIQEVLSAGGKVHMSQRGWGNLVKGDWNGKEADIVQEDYTLKTFDFVVGGSTKGAQVDQVLEQKFDVLNLIEVGPCMDCQRYQQTQSKGGSNEMDVIKTLEELKKAYPDLCLQLEKEAVAKKEPEIKEAMRKEWEVESKKIAEGIQKGIEESPEYKEYKKGMDAHKAVVMEMVKLLKPYVSEMGEDEDDLEDQIEEIRKQMELIKAENEQLKDKIKKDKQAADEKEKAKKKVSEMTAGKEHGELIAERLADCKTEAEVVERFSKEEEFVKKVLAEKTKEPTGDGKTLNENKEDEKNKKKKEELTEDQKRQQQLSGVA